MPNSPQRPAYELDGLYGNCPVQGDGRIDGVPFYFRARGDRWSLSIGADPLGNPAWRHVRRYGSGFDAGWMSDDEARSLLEQALARYEAGLPGLGEDATEEPPAVP